MMTYPSRSVEFGIGQNGDAPYQFTPNGLNQQYMPSGNGMSASTYARMGPGGMRAPSMNGYAPDTYNQFYRTGYAVRI